MTYEIIFLLQIICLIVIYCIVCSLIPLKSNAVELHLIIIFMFSIFIYNLGILFELICTTIDSMLIVMYFTNISIIIAMTAIFNFTLKYSNIKQRKLYSTLINSVCIIVTFIIITSSKHKLFYKDAYIEKLDLYPHLVIEPGIFCYIYRITLLIISISLLSISIYDYILHRKAASKVKRSKLLFILSIFVPTLALLLRIKMAFRLINLIPYGIVFSCVLISYLINHYSLFDITMSAKDSILDTMDLALIIIDKHYNFLYLNQSAKVFIEEYQEYNTDSDKYFFLITENNCFQLGERFYERQITPVYDNENLQGYAICIYDTTDNKILIEKLISLKESAEHANRSKSKFLADISHEIRTPMNAIIGMSEITLQNHLPENIRFNIENIFHASKSLMGLINSILDISKIEAGKLEINNEHYYLDSMLSDISNITIATLNNKPITFHAYIQKDIPNGLTGDIQKVKQILLNLLGNASKYTYTGKITLSINYSIINDEITLFIKVSDTGDGIDESFIDSIFERYSKSNSIISRNHFSTGLGLAITKQLVELLNGSISVSSKKNEGTTFSLSIKQHFFDDTPLPFTEITKELLSQINKSEYYHTKNDLIYPNARVLIVDDIEVNLLVAKGLIEPYKIKVDFAKTSYEAIAQIESHNYNIIFMDHMLDGLDGVTTAREIKNINNGKYSTIPIIALTANAIQGSKEFYLRNNFSDYLSKPINHRRLDEILKNWIPKALQQPKPLNNKKTSSILPSDTVIDGINYTLGLINANGKVSDYNNLLKSYRNEVSNTLEIISALSRSDLKAFQTKVHGIKGISNTIGATALANYAYALEDSAKHDALIAIKQYLPDFIIHLQKMVGNIDDYLRDYEESHPASFSISSLSTVPWEDILNALNQYDSILAEKIINSINIDMLSIENAQNLFTLKEYVNSLEYKKAIELIYSINKN